MKLKWTVIWVVTIIVLAGTSTVPAVVWDTGREQTNAKVLTDNLEFGSVVWISKDNKKGFPAIYTPSGPYGSDNAIILLHSMGGHPDWPVVISPLRRSFRYSNWTTLSIQLPVLDPERIISEYSKTLAEAADRIKAAVEFLHAQGRENVYLLGYGFGATAAAYYLSQKPDQQIPGFISVSILARKFLNPKVDILDLYKHISIPVLDIYASDDQASVIQGADDRRLAINHGDGSNFSQTMIPDSDHSYTNSETKLYQAIDEWLQWMSSLHERQLTAAQQHNEEFPQGPPDTQ